MTNFFGCDRVVLVDDRYDGSIDETGKCAPGVEEAAAIFRVFGCQENLSCHYVMPAEHFLVSMNELYLSSRRSCLQILEPGPRLADSQHLAANGNRS
jgi:hypothetical protein